MNLRLAISTFSVLGLMLYTISLLPAGTGGVGPGIIPVEPLYQPLEPAPPALAEPRLLIYRDPVLIATPMEFYPMPVPPGQNEMERPETFEPLIIEFDPESSTPHLISESHQKPITQEVQL